MFPIGAPGAGSGSLGGVSAHGEPWERTYATRSDTELSWYEREPATSLRLIESVATGPLAAVVDIGSGTSTLVDRLLDLGFQDLTVLDLSAHALEQVRTRLGDRAGRFGPSSTSSPVPKTALTTSRWLVAHCAPVARW